jgi:hypothetical protein
MRVPKFIVPLLVLAALLGGYFLRTAFTQPTTSVSIGAGGGKTLACVVDGVKCKGTAQFFTSLYKDVPGITGIETYATDHRAIFSYDPALITPERIKSIMEEPIPLKDGTSVQAFRCVSME